MTGHLLHIGYPKTGSKFLQRWFAGHPQLAFADGGIAGFRDVYAIARASITPRADLLYRVTSYEGLTAPQANAGQTIIDYERWRTVNMASSQSAVCTTLAELFPGARVLIVTRGFRSMILSSYSQYVRSGGDDDLADLIAKGSRSDLDPWNYDFLIDLYQRAFGESNVIVMPYELLRNDVDAFTRALEAFLGLTHFAAFPDRVNASLSPVEMAWYPRLTRMVRALPIGSRLRRLYLEAAFANRFRSAIAVLQRVRALTPLTADAIPDATLNAYRGKADSLRGNPLYAPYATDYLFNR
jgi:hypothetical protein